MSLPGIINNYAAWGGNPPMRVPSGDGYVYVGRTEKADLGRGAIYYAVYRRKPGGAAELVWRSGPDGGQGTLAAYGGQLVATYYQQSGDGKDAIDVVIGGYVPLPGTPGSVGPQGPAGPQGEPGPQGPQGEPGSSVVTPITTAQVQAAILDWAAR